MVLHRLWGAAARTPGVWILAPRYIALRRYGLVGVVGAIGRRSHEEAACHSRARRGDARRLRRRASRRRATEDGGLTTPVTGTQTNTTTGAVTPFAGTLAITSFALNSTGQLVANGTVSDTTGNVIGTFANALVTPSGTCPILSLHIGAIHLNLLGLVVDLNPVDLNITAQPGPGQLLGNLLCAVVHLLDNGGPLSGLTNLLDRLNALLGQL
jgi:hypothetical protein